MDQTDNARGNQTAAEVVLTEAVEEVTEVGRAGEATGADDRPRRSIEAAPSFNSHQGRANLLVKALPEGE